MKTFGIIGDGFIAPRHKQAIKSTGNRLKWVCDKDYCYQLGNNGHRNNNFKNNNYKTQKPVDYVAVCTPNYLHNRMIHFFALNGSTVLTEKPPVIKSDQIKKFDPYPVFVVLQLRYHPKIKSLKRNLDLSKSHKGSIRVVVKRDISYWTGWKGDELKSGGILFNLGVHYLDLLIHLFGNQYRIIDCHYSKRKAFGVINFGGNLINFDFEIRDDDVGQTRELIIDGERIELSNKDNLSYEDMHTKVYEEMLAGRGIHISKTYNVIKLIENLKSWGNQSAQSLNRPLAMERQSDTSVTSQPIVV